MTNDKPQKEKKHKLSHLPRISDLSKINKKHYCNRVYSKSISSKINFSANLFININLRGSIFNNCKFTSTKIICVDFNGASFKKTNFKNVEFKKCLFYGTIFKDCKFNNCSFNNCTFINTNTDNITTKIEQPTNKNLILKKPPTIIISESFVKNIKKYKEIPHLSTSRLLHIKGGKINNATLHIISQKIKSEELILFALDKIFSQPKNKKTPYTVYSLLEKIRESIDSNYIS